MKITRQNNSIWLIFVVLLLTVCGGGGGGTSPPNDDTPPPGDPATAPTAPDNVAAISLSSSTIRVTWQDNSTDETGFKLERSTTSDTGFTQIVETAADATRYDDNGLSSSTPYYYRVRANKSGTHSGYSNTATATTDNPPNTAPLAPSNLSASALSSTTIELNWLDNSNNETGFKIDRGMLSGQIVLWSPLITVAANTQTYTNTGLTASTTYYYRVRAYNAIGDSAYSNLDSATTQAPSVPNAPSGLSALATNPTRVNLSWTDNSSNETGFRIERQNPINSTLWIEVATVAANNVSYSHTGLAETWPGYRVRAYSGSSNSGYSNIAYAPPKLRIVNNLYSSNDWGNRNTILHVGIGPTQNTTTERLWPYSTVSFGNEQNLLAIAPAYNLTSSYRDFDVSGDGSNYVVIVQMGWWEIYVPPVGTGWWTKHWSQVLDQFGNCCVYKSSGAIISNHSSGYHVLYTDDPNVLNFPQGSYNNTL